MEPYVVKEYPEKSWSISKMKLMDNCYREYYYNYYGSHNGWINNSPMESKLAWRLKKLTNIWIMFGDKVHITLKKTINSLNNKSINEEVVKKHIKDLLNNGVKESSLKAKDGSWDEYPRGEMLQEYYYDSALKIEDIEKIKERINLVVEGFYSSATYNELKNHNCDLLEVDEGKFDYIFIHNMKVFSLLDLLYVDGNGDYIIVDWKTGKAGDFDKEQLLVYALYVMEKYEVSIENIKGRMEYLTCGTSEEFTFCYEDIEGMLAKIQGDINIMNNFLLSIEENIPRDITFFRKCDNERICNKCKFRKLCLEEENNEA